MMQNKKCNEINETSATLTSSTKMSICKTPVQKTNPNLKRKTNFKNKSNYSETNLFM